MSCMIGYLCMMLVFVRTF